MITPHNMPPTVYVVVEVVSGVATGAACFSVETNAVVHATALRRDADVNDDDVQVFECTVG